MPYHKCFEKRINFDVGCKTTGTNGFLEVFGCKKKIDIQITQLNRVQKQYDLTRLIFE